MGVWTKEEFYDAVIFASIVAVVSFCITLFYRYVSKWLELHKFTEE